MSTKLYVGGLPYLTTDAQLAELLSPYGSVVSARVITDRFTGQSRGSGFVEMGTGEAAQKAMNTLNGSKLNGRTIVVNEAKPLVYGRVSELLVRGTQHPELRITSPRIITGLFIDPRRGKPMVKRTDND